MGADGVAVMPGNCMLGCGVIRFGDIAITWSDGDDNVDNAALIVTVKGYNGTTLAVVAELTGRRAADAIADAQAMSEASSAWLATVLDSLERDPSMIEAARRGLASRQMSADEFNQRANALLVPGELDFSVVGKKFDK